MRYWVVGGEYTDTTFRTLAPGAHEERLGPFASYGEAFATWTARARATIDDATVWYHIVTENGERASAA